MKLRQFVVRSCLVCLALAPCPVPGEAAELFVDESTGSASNDGLSWATALADIQQALDASSLTPEPDTIRVAGGTYGSITAVSDTTVIGGYPPGGGERDLALNDSQIRYGEINVRAEGVENFTLDGFYVRSALNEPENNPAIGAAFFISFSENVTLKNLVVFANTAIAPCVISWDDYTNSCSVNPHVAGGAGLYAFQSSLDIHNVFFGLSRSGVRAISDPFDSRTLTCDHLCPYGDDLPASSILLRECTGSINNVTVYGHANNTSRVMVDVRGMTVSNSTLWGQISRAHAAEVLASPDMVSYTNYRVGNITGGEGNFTERPLWASGPEGGWYQRQVVTGHAEDSPCVDAGGQLASELGLDGWTTRIDEGEDAGIVDVGYHWPIPTMPRPVTMEASHGEDGTRISYFPYAGYSYDVIRGHLSELMDEGSAIDIGSVECIASDDTTGDVLDETPSSGPGAGEVYFYLIREAGTPTPYGFSSFGKELIPSAGGCD